MTKKVRVRFAPSPTGSLHIGSLRTALYNYLFAKKTQGIFILRIEDTDQKRTVPGAVEEIISVLRDCGLTYDEGPELVNGKMIEKGDYGPYIQSGRLDLYKKFGQQLLQIEKAYPCFCSAERLAELRKKQEAQNLPPGYDGHCRDILKTEALERVNKGEKHVIRLKVPREGQTQTEDLIRSRVSFNNIILEDAVLQKSDGFPTYHLANVVDDHFMEISHVIRGEEWLPSLPIHLLLYQALEWPAPEFAHLPLMLSTTRKKLSKRDGDTAAKDYLKEYLPMALLNFIALLGWNPKTNQEFYPNLDELAKDFDLKKINKAGAIFDVKKLNYINREHLRISSTEALSKIAGLNLSAETAKEYLPMALDRSEKISDIKKSIQFLLNDEINYDRNLLIPKNSNQETIRQNLTEIKYFLNNLKDQDWQLAQGLKETTILWIKNQGKTNLEMLWPLRVALSGLEKSPDVFDMACALGKSRTIQRIEKGIEQLI